MRVVVNSVAIDEPTEFEKYLLFAFGKPPKREIVNKPISLRFPSVTLVTGESGSGKTLFLKSLAENFDKRYRIAYLPHLPSSELLIRLHRDEQRWLQILCRCGLADARAWFTNCEYLSAGQQERARIALALMNAHEWDILIVDDFLNLLDRQCARVVANMFARQLREMNKSCVVATGLTDLITALKPDFHIHIPLWGHGHEIAELHWGDYRLPELSELHFSFVNYEIAKRFLPLHYRNPNVVGCKKVLVACYKDEPIGCCIVTPPIPVIEHHRLPREAEIRAIYDWNEYEVISRVIVHPHWRGCGVGKLLVKKLIELTDAKFILIGATMLKFHNFVKDLGFVYWASTSNGTVEWWAYEKNPRKVLGGD